MVLEQSLSQPWDIAQPRHGVTLALRHFGLYIRHPHKSRQTRAEQTQRQTGGIGVGVEAHHQGAKDGSHQPASQHARCKTQGIAAGVHHGGKACNGSAQHHALGPEVNDTGFFIDEQAQGRQSQHRAGLQGGRQQQRVGLHQAAPLAAGTQRTR